MGLCANFIPALIKHTFYPNVKLPSKHPANMNRKVFTLPPTSDFHVHLRDGEMMELVVPTIPAGGVDTVYVMVCIPFLPSSKLYSLISARYQTPANAHTSH